MSTSCPHCGEAILEHQQICEKCEELFQSLKNPPASAPARATPAPPFSSTTPYPVLKPATMTTRKRGWLLLAIGVGLYFLPRVLGPAYDQHSGVIFNSLPLLMMCAGIVVGVLGIVRIIVGRGPR